MMTDRRWINSCVLFLTVSMVVCASRIDAHARDYVYGLGSSPLVEVTNDGGSTVTQINIRLPNRLLAVVTQTDRHYLLQDHLGSTTVFTGSGTASDTVFDYTPYGNVTAYPSVTDHTLPGINYLFQGHEYEPELSLYNFKARLYSPSAALFLSTDPAGTSISPYSPFGRNPVNYVDLDGLVKTWADLVYDVRNEKMVFVLDDHAFPHGQLLYNMLLETWGFNRALVESASNGGAQLSLRDERAAFADGQSVEQSQRAINRRAKDIARGGRVGDNHLERARAELARDTIFAKNSELNVKYMGWYSPENPATAKTMANGGGPAKTYFSWPNDIQDALNSWDRSLGFAGIGHASRSSNPNTEIGKSSGYRPVTTLSTDGFKILESGASEHAVVGLAFTPETYGNDVYTSNDTYTREWNTLKSNPDYKFGSVYDVQGVGQVQLIRWQPSSHPTTDNNIIHAIDRTLDFLGRSGE